LYGIGLVEPPRVQVALFSGYSNVRSAGFAKAMGHLKKKLLVEYPSSTSYRLTPAGIEAAGCNHASAGNGNNAVTNAAAQNRIKALLKPKAREIFDALSGGQTRERVAVAMLTGYTNERSAGFAKALSTLSSLQIVEYPGPKLVRLTDLAFPLGRPGTAAATDTTTGAVYADV